MSVVTVKAVTSYIHVGTTGKDTIKLTSQGQSVVITAGSEKPVTFNSLLRVPGVEHSLDPMSSVCVNNHFMQFTSENCVVK